MRAQSLCVWANNSEVGMNRDERGRVDGPDGWSGVDWAEKLDVNAIAIVRFVAPNFSLLRISPSAFGSIARAT